MSDTALPIPIPAVQTDNAVVIPGHAHRRRSDKARDPATTFSMLSGTWKSVAAFGVIGVMAGMLFWKVIWIDPGEVKAERAVYRQALTDISRSVTTGQQSQADRDDGKMSRLYETFGRLRDAQEKSNETHLKMQISQEATARTLTDVLKSVEVGNALTREHNAKLDQILSKSK